MVTNLAELILVKLLTSRLTVQMTCNMALRLRELSLV